MSQQITTLSFFRYRSLGTKIWAFGMMQFAHKRLRSISGLRFYRLLGSGKERFNPFPDWEVYALLQVWENETQAKAFFEDHELFATYRKRSQEHWILYMKHLMSRGEWGGVNPFVKSNALDNANPYLAVITRATIKTRLLLRFWKYVPHSQEQLWGNPGLIYSKGIGEFPIKQMATFSLWKDKKSLDTFAYQTKAHVKAIGMTRKLDWYSEELFSRFQPYKSVGTWEGRNPLSQISLEGES
ncbi:MAG: DUF3291 domain-containing protein [Bacteroidota bacterium]